MKVLVIDDAPTLAASCAQALADAGYEARAATSVDAALVELVDARPDAVVLDYCLDRDAELLRMALVRLRLPVLVVSGLDDDAARSCAEAHDWPYLPKPFDDATLQSAVAALLTPLETPSMPGTRNTLVPRAEALPAPPPVAQVTPSGRPATQAVQIVDHISDMVGMVILGLLCHAGKIGGTETLFAIGAILGLGTGLRQIGGRLGGAGVGVAGLAILGLGRWLAPAAGAAELARTSGMFGLLLALVLGGAGCGSTDGATAALATATTVLKATATVRQYLCARELDPLLGDPRPAPASSGGTLPPAPPPSPPAASDAGAPAQDGG